MDQTTTRTVRIKATDRDLAADRAVHAYGGRVVQVEQIMDREYAVTLADR